MYVIIMSKALIVFVIGVLLIGCVSAISVNYYYSPTCGHCKSIEPFIQKSISSYPAVKWNILNVTKGSYNIQGTPLLELFTTDGRKIVLGGSADIPKFLECELKEQSNLNCETYSANECIADSWFIR